MKLLSILFITMLPTVVSFGQAINLRIPATPPANILPSQTSQSGKYLTTNGSETLWSTVSGSAGAKQDSLNWYLPETYGAVGNGSTDDAAAFTAMIAAMPSRGGKVHLSTKTYIISSTVTINKPVHFYGNGSSNPSNLSNLGTTFKSGVDNIVMFRIAEDWVSFHDMLIYNASTTSTSGCGIKADSNLRTSSHLYKFNIVNVNFWGFYNQIEATGAFGWTVSNCYFNFHNYAIKVSDIFAPDAGDSHITGCTFLPQNGVNANTAIYQTSSGGLRITNNKGNWNGTTKMDYFYDADIIGTGDLIIADNSIENYKKSAIRLIGHSSYVFPNISITGNQLSSLSSNIYPDVVIDTIINLSIQSNVFYKYPSGNDTCIKITQSSYINLDNTYAAGYGTPVYYRGTNTNYRGDGAGVKYTIPVYSSTGVLQASNTLKDSANIFSITTPTFGQVYPANYSSAVTGSSQISFSSNLTGGVAGVEAAIINSNINGNGFSFFQQTAVNTGIHILRMKNNGYVGIGTANPQAILDLTSTTRGMLPPRMTSTQRDAITSKGTGETIYCTDCTATDTSTGVMQTYNGSTWKNNW